MNLNKGLTPSPVFSIILYQNKAEENRVNKTDYLTTVATLNGALRDACSVITPSIVIEMSSFPTFNYVGIPTFNRYYFVQNITSITKNLWRIDLRADVLMTYKTGINALHAITARQEFDFNNLLTDNEMPVENGMKFTSTYVDLALDITKFNVVTKKYRYVLTAFSDFTTTATRKDFEKTFLTNAKYLMNDEQVTTFLKKLNTPDFKTSLENVFANTPMEGLVSLRAYPFDIGALWNTAGQEPDDIIIGSYTMNAKGYLYVVNPDEKCTIKIAQFRPPVNVTWREYSDELTLYLPFYGFTDIDAAEFYTSDHYEVYYIIDFDTGVTTINIYRKEDNQDLKLVRTLSTSIAIDIALSATNAAETVKNVLNFGMMTALTIGTTVATGGAATPAITGAIMGAGREISSMQQRIHRGTNAGGAWGGVKSPLRPYLITAKRKYVEPEHYATLHGRPSRKGVTLGSQHGFTKIDDVHIEGTGFESITQDEKTLLETQLKNGVIFEKIKLATPTGLTFNSTAITLSWDAVENAEQYEIYLNSELFATTEDIVLTLTDYDNVPDGIVNVRVRATAYSFESSDFSAEISFNHHVPLNAPVISAVGSVVSWNAVPNAVLYRVYLKNFEGLTAEYSVENATSTDISTMWEGMSDGDVYVAITANPGTGSFEWSVSPRSNQITVVKAPSTVTLEAGTYKWKDNVALADISQDLEFTSNNTSYHIIEANETRAVITYTDSYMAAVYNNGAWANTAYQTITLDTDQTVSAEFYKWAITDGNLVKQATGETWLLNDSDALTQSNQDFASLNFTSDSQSFVRIVRQYDNRPIPPVNSLLYYKSDGTYVTAVYTNDDGIAFWNRQAYRTLTFETAPTGDLLTWLQANGTKQ